VQKQIRVIPRLDIKGPNLVKGIHLEGLRVLGDPAVFAKYYYENGADELILNDVTASLFETGPQLDIIREVAKNIFIPLTVGGGIQTINQIREILKSGADKVYINSMAHENLDFITEASKVFGSSTIVAGIDCNKQFNGHYTATYLNGRELSKFDVVTWAKKLEEACAGEIFFTSVDQDGTGRGFALEVIRQITNAVSIPVVVSGGAYDEDSFLNLIDKVDVSGISAASIFHYKICHELKNESLYDRPQGNFTYLKDNKDFTMVQKIDLASLKKKMIEKGVLCRKVW
jgi:cyclase